MDAIDTRIQELFLTRKAELEAQGFLAEVAHHKAVNEFPRFKAQAQAEMSTRGQGRSSEWDKAARKLAEANHLFALIKTELQAEMRSYKEAKQKLLIDQAQARFDLETEHTTAQSFLLNRKKEASTAYRESVAELSRLKGLRNSAKVNPLQVPPEYMRDTGV